jgi:hypothetical protein
MQPIPDAAACLHDLKLGSDVGDAALEGITNSIYSWMIYLMESISNIFIMNILVNYLFFVYLSIRVPA